MKKKIQKKDSTQFYHKMEKKKTCKTTITKKTTWRTEIHILVNTFHRVVTQICQKGISKDLT